MLESLFNRVVGLQGCNFIEKETITQVFSCEFCEIFKDTQREKAPSNRIPALIENTNMGIWVVGTSNQLYVIGS